MIAITRSGVLLFTVLFAISFAGCANSDNKLATNTATPLPTAGASPAATQGPPKAKLNLNTATAAELLATIPGFGTRMVHEFEEYRPYKSIQQFRREIGKYVNPEQVAEYEKYVFVPINENDSDAHTLQQIPGLDAAEAEKLIAGRPYATRDAFLAKLTEYVSAPELEIAKTYLSTP
jgi:DNA uptake protein ComE-like DNA-binding protein